MDMRNIKRESIPIELDKANAEATLSNYKGGSNAIIPSLLTVGE